MTFRTPGRPSRRLLSTLPSLPTTPTAVRCLPGMGRASYPMASMTSTTRRMSASVASWPITTSMAIPVLAVRAKPECKRRRRKRLGCVRPSDLPAAAVVGHEDEAVPARGADELRHLRALELWVDVRDEQPPRPRRAGELGQPLRGQVH